jgi:succinyl-diaminopimelate desuccinylase
LAESVQNGALSTYRDQDRRLGLNRDLSLTVDVDFLTDRPCTKTEPEDPLVAAADWAVRRATGREPVYGGVPGATDGTYLWAVKNIPIVTMGAGDREVPHQVDEWVDLDQLAETARTYALIALRYLWPDQTHAP